MELSVVLMDGIRPLYFLGGLDSWNVKVHYHRFLTAAHNDAFERLISTGIYLLMGNVRRNVNKISGTCHRGELQMITPAHSGVPVYDKDNAFELAVMMRSGLGIWMDTNSSGPEL